MKTETPFFCCGSRGSCAGVPACVCQGSQRSRIRQKESAEKKSPKMCINFEMKDDRIVGMNGDEFGAIRNSIAYFCGVDESSAVVGRTIGQLLDDYWDILIDS